MSDIILTEDKESSLTDMSQQDSEVNNQIQTLKLKSKKEESSSTFLENTISIKDNENKNAHILVKSPSSLIEQVEEQHHRNDFNNSCYNRYSYIKEITLFLIKEEDSHILKYAKKDNSENLNNYNNIIISENIGTHIIA